MIMAKWHGGQGSNRPCFRMHLWEWCIRETLGSKRRDQPNGKISDPGLDSPTAPTGDGSRAARAKPVFVLVLGFTTIKRKLSRLAKWVLEYHPLPSPRPSGSPVPALGFWELIQASPIHLPTSQPGLPFQIPIHSRVIQQT